MKFHTATLHALFWAATTVFSVNAAVFDMNAENIGYVRTDPILDQQCLSGHVHAFYGAKALFPKTTYDDLRAVDPSEVSGQIVENKSLYWHPAVYRQLSNGQWELQETSMSIYYLWDGADSSVRAFPPGFAMIAGFEDRIQPQASFNFVCEEVDRETQSFQDEPCEGEFFIEFKMPNCWNGQPRDPDDTHVAYTDDGGNEPESTCPDGFFKIPQLWFFVEFPNGYKGGTHKFSDGSDVIHFDYFNGWDEAELENALRRCDNGDFAPTGESRCNQFSYKGDRFAPSEKFPVTEITDERVDIVSEFITNSPRKADGSCADSDQPKTGGISVGPTPTNRPTQAPVANPTPRPTLRPTSAPVVAPTAPPTNAPVGGNLSCKEVCEVQFEECEENVEATCSDEIFLAACAQECLEEVEEDELEECVYVWCFDDQEGCFEDQFKRCRRKRRKCRRSC